MKKVLLFIFLFFLIFAHGSAQNSKKSKVITINSVRVMELFKKENNAQYRTKPDDEAADKQQDAEKKDTSSGRNGRDAVVRTGAAKGGSTARADRRTRTGAAGNANAAGEASSAGVAADARTGAAGNTNAAGKPDGDGAGGADAVSEGETAVTKEEAQKAVDEKKDEIIVFTGGISLSVKDGSAVSSIEADKVVYNRSENTIEASGNVRYSRKTGGSNGAEEFIGELFLFNIEEMEGVFLDGTIKQAPRKKGDNPFTIQSALIGRDASGTTGFKNATLSTNTDPDDEPLWSIRASRIWLLPGNELAFVNGYFSIGIVPLFYLPFFYHPADEMIFHPVFGFRNREGYFVQTTTYLFGRKPLDTDSKKSG